MAVEIGDNFFALLGLGSGDFGVFSLELDLLFLVVSSHGFELQTHVIGPYIAVGVLSELGAIKLVVELVLDCLLLEVLQSCEDLSAEKLLH